MDKVTGPGHTALLTASEKGHVEVVVELLSAGADASKCGEGGLSPLHMANVTSLVC